MSSPRCAICSGKTVRVSSINSLTGNSGFSWENDSTLQLLGWDKADVHLRICRDCMHMVLHPVFDASALYGEEGARVRREVRDAYERPPAGGVGCSDFDLARDLRAVSGDLERFQRVTRFISEKMQSVFPGTENIRILDWGGGDGYVSAVYARVVEAVTTIRTSAYIFDHTEWAGVEGNLVGIEDLKAMDKFHVLILSGILEHTHDPVETLRTAAEFLHPGGVVICEVPDERYVLFNGLMRKKFGMHYHVCFFNRRSLHRAIRRAGFESVLTRLDPCSSYRGKPIRFFLGIGCKPGATGDVSEVESSRIKQLSSFFVYGVRGLARSLRNRLRARLGRGER